MSFSDNYGLFNGDPDNLSGLIVVTDAMSRLYIAPHFKAMHYLAGGAEKHQKSDELDIVDGVAIQLNGSLSPRSEQLFVERIGHVYRRDVINVWLGAELRVQRKCHLLDMHQIVDGIVRHRRIRPAQEAE
jgi:hypothetical protein